MEYFEGVHKLEGNYYLLQTHTVTDLLLFYFIKFIYLFIKLFYYFNHSNDAMIFWWLIIYRWVLVKVANLMMQCVYYASETLCDGCRYCYIITNTFIHGMTSWERGVR